MLAEGGPDALTAAIEQVVGVVQGATWRKLYDADCAKQLHGMADDTGEVLDVTDDPTALSYVLTALIQVDLGARQELLEAPDTVDRLVRLDRLLAREAWFLKQGLRPIMVDPHRRGGRRS